MNFTSFFDRIFSKSSAAAVAIGLVLTGFSAVAQVVASTPQTPQSASANVTGQPPQLSAGAWDVLRLVQDNVSEDTVVAYINNSARPFNLSSEEIVYLRQQGVSDRVITAMLNQKPKTSAPAPAPVRTEPTPAPAPAPETAPAPAQQPPAPAASAPAPVYVQPQTVYVPAPSPVYVEPPPVYYYPRYYYPPVSLSFGFGFGGHHGGHWGVGIHGHH